MFSFCCFSCSFAFSLWCTGSCCLIHSSCCSSGSFWSGFCSFDGVSCWGVGGGGSDANFCPLDTTSFRTPLGVLSISAATVAFAVAVDVVVTFFQGQAFAMCHEAPHKQQWGFQPSTTTSILLSLHIKMLGMFLKFLRVNVTSMTITSSNSRLADYVRCLLHFSVLGKKRSHSSFRCLRASHELSILFFWCPFTPFSAEIICS